MTDWFFTLKGDKRHVCRAPTLNLAIDDLIRAGYDTKDVTGVLSRAAFTLGKRR